MITAWADLGLVDCCFVAGHKYQPICSFNFLHGVRSVRMRSVSEKRIDSKRDEATESSEWDGYR